MNNKLRIRYYLLNLSLPLFVLLHGVNENPGLISFGILVSLLAYYVLTTVAVAFVSMKIYHDFERSLLFSLFVLFVFFFFGVLKDFAKKYEWLSGITRYLFLLPAILAITIAFGIYLKKRSWKPSRFTQFITAFFLINLCVETGTLAVRSLRGDELRKGLGDTGRTLVKDIQLADSSRTPFIFWIVFDEYTSSGNLKKNWAFDNPLDSILREKDFFVADSAVSNYNYTHYSLSSTLDMQYLKNLGNHSIIESKDGIYKTQTIANNNVVDLLKRKNYKIENYTFYDLDGSPAHAKFDDDPLIKLLIDNQTLSGRIGMDIGWNFRYLLAADKNLMDSINNVNVLTATAAEQRLLLDSSLAAAKARKNSSEPCFFMFHFMYTHMPLLYNADGSLNLSFSKDDFLQGSPGVKNRYVPCVRYANTVIDMLTDSIKSLYAGKDLVIVLQGDHGFKFDENDPSFENDSQKILYAVYCSDQDYSKWNRSMSSVNGFRIVFNKYFYTDFPLLPNRANNLFSR